MTTVIFKEPNSIPMIIMSDTMKDKEALNLLKMLKETETITLHTGEDIANYVYKDSVFFHSFVPNDDFLCITVKYVGGAEK